MDMAKSISYDQTEIINWILDLHVPSHHVDCDQQFIKDVDNAIK